MAISRKTAKMNIHRLSQSLAILSYGEKIDLNKTETLI